MGSTAQATRPQLGRRIELMAMDPHFEDITIAMHRAQTEHGPAYDIHTYSQKPGADARLDAIAAAMVIAGGMAHDQSRPTRLWFPCGSAHEPAARRAFVVACKLDPNQEPQPLPMEIYDKKTDATITVAGSGGGRYRITADAQGEKVLRRVATVAGGLVKLADMTHVDGSIDAVYFACGKDHDLLVALLLKLALNARGVLREQELAATRGVLSAPSQQR